jgi:hypothetical protein
METLEQAILWLAPKIGFIHECLGLGKFAEIAVTADGYFLGRARGDCGFNYFLGRPSVLARARAWDLFRRLSKPHQEELIRRLHARGIPPQALDIPELTD